MKYWVTGCARSGTWLLMRCMTAFKDIVGVPGEADINSFLKCPDNHVGKRAHNSIFSQSLPESEVALQASILVANPHIRVIHIVRDMEDVLRHPDYGGGVNQQRWEDSQRQTTEYPDLISAMVRYEDLCDMPDATQGVLAQALGLAVEHKFSSYPDFVAPELFEATAKWERYGPRPIERQRE